MNKNNTDEKRLELCEAHKQKQIVMKIESTRGLIQNPIDLIAELPEDEYMKVVDELYNNIHNQMVALEKWRDEVMILIEKERNDVSGTDGDGN